LLGIAGRLLIARVGHRRSAIIRPLWRSRTTSVNSDHGAILSAKQHDERPLSGMAQVPLNDGLGRKSAIKGGVLDAPFLALSGLVELSPVGPLSGAKQTPLCQPPETGFDPEQTSPMF
jgi:hypothetical protein